MRFAPSPSGVLHVGGARTAFFNWMYARRWGGKFVLRIEDTNEQKSTAESEAAMLSALNWIGLDHDEGPVKGGAHGPYRQSERIDSGIYDEKLDMLLQNNQAYPCFLTGSALFKAMKESKYNVKSPWANAPKAEVQRLLDNGAPHTIRFRIPKDREFVTTRDIFKGEKRWPVAKLEDIRIYREGGRPLYNFACVVDDGMMGMTHIFRGADHFYNTSLQILLYEAMGFDTPRFGHLPLILNDRGQKLSKSDGSTNIEQFREEGMSAGAMLNYIATLGLREAEQVWAVADLVQKLDFSQLAGKKGTKWDQHTLQRTAEAYRRQFDDTDSAQVQLA